MSLEDPEATISVAPAEGQRPLFIMTDPNFEVVFNPDKFYLGSGMFNSERARKLTYRKYFNQRLLDMTLMVHLLVIWTTCLLLSI